MERRQCGFRWISSGRTRSARPFTCPMNLALLSGTITSLAFYTNFYDSPSNGATKIWLGSTNVQDLVLAGFLLLK